MTPSTGTSKHTNGNGRQVVVWVMLSVIILLSLAAITAGYKGSTDAADVSASLREYRAGNDQRMANFEVWLKRVEDKLDKALDNK